MLGFSIYIFVGLQDETPTIVIQNDVTYDKDDEDINENDDDDLDDVEKEEETKIHHLILAQFDKVFPISYSFSRLF